MGTKDAARHSSCLGLAEVMIGDLSGREVETAEHRLCLHTSIYCYRKQETREAPPYGHVL